MAAHEATDYYQSHVCLVHSIGTSQESYLDQNLLIFSMKAMKALNRYDLELCTTEPMSPPSLDSLGQEAKPALEHFMMLYYCQ